MNQESRMGKRRKVCEVWNIKNVTTTLCLAKNTDTYGPCNPAVDRVSVEKRGEFRERKKVGRWGEKSERME